MAARRAAWRRAAAPAWRRRASSGTPGSGELILMPAGDRTPPVRAVSGPRSTGGRLPFDVLRRLGACKLDGVTTRILALATLAFLCAGCSAERIPLSPTGPD